MEFCANKEITAMKKSDLLSTCYTQTETQLSFAVNDWQNMPEAALHARPADGGWSAVECLDHLNFYMNSYMPLVHAAIQRSTPEAASAAYHPGWLGGWFTRLMQPDEKSGRPKKKMKSPANARPALNLQASQVINSFIQNLESMLQAIEKAHHAKLNLRIPTTLHPLIKLKLGDTIAFLVAHNQRHVQQAVRAVAANTTVGALV